MMTSFFSLKLISRSWMVAILLISAGCGSESVNSAVGDSPVVVNENTSAGTNMGNPTEKQKKLTFQLSDSSEASLTAHCMPYTINGHQTQKCFLTPETYRFGVLAIYILECHPGDGREVSVSCNIEGSKIAKRQTWYEGNLIPVEVSQDLTEFPQSMSEDINLTVGGIQVVVSYLEQVFPTETENSDLGQSVRICTAPTRLLSAEITAEQCGLSNAMRGDYLYTDKNGLMGFLDIANPGMITSERHELYSSYIGSNGFMDGTAHYLSLAPPNPEFTSGADYPIAGYFAPIFATPVDKDFSDYNLRFDLKNTITFIDGWRYTNQTHEPICVQALTTNECSVDADPVSVGSFDPVYDASYTPQLPLVFVD